MKLPVGLGSRLFYRVVLPGGIVTAVLFWLAAPKVQFGETIVTPTIVFLCFTIGVGLLFLFFDRPIYILFEGRRYWPGLCRRIGMRRERRRLARIHHRMRKNNSARASNNIGRDRNVECRRRYLEATVHLSEFPLDAKTQKPTALWPTRLGNLIAAYEQYPDVKYGLDSVFFWPRLWVSLSNELRTELDNQQSIADGAIYSTFALALSFVIALAATIFESVMTGVWPAYMAIAILVALAVLTFFMQKISLFTCQVFGEFFMATFDQHRDVLKIPSVLKVLNEETGIFFGAESTKDRNRAAWRFLKWHRVRLPGEQKNTRLNS